MQERQGAAISIVNVSRRFRVGHEDVWALHGVSLEIAPGEFVALIGRSGSGKTTLLNLIAGLDKPSEGDVQVDGRSVPAMSEKQLVELRRRDVGFVFQSFGLLPLLSAEENVELPLRIAGTGHGERARRVRQVLEMVGLGRRAHHRPYELSGGEQQRVAIARALAIRPRLILADEPTGELDSATATAIFTLLRETARAEGVTIAVSTHDRLVIEQADRVEELANGRHVTDGKLLHTVTARERSVFAAPMPDDLVHAAPSEAGFTTSRPSSLIGADLSHFARPAVVGAAPHEEERPAPAVSEPSADIEDDGGISRWARPGKR